ncbi:MAG: hypothetical protein MUC29_06945 [Pyrinomonadaceae bacterium]|nr:hypothetical protein [Pyrinomonadaceae bacterium]
MKKVIFLILVFSIFTSCEKVENTIDINTNKVASVPTNDAFSALKPIKPSIKLNSKELKYLNESLPMKIREVLENADKFEVLAEIKTKSEFDGDGTTFEPNRVVKISDEMLKKKILESFYFDASKETSPSNCYEPHHGIIANYQGEKVEIEICFSCSRFEVKSSQGKFDGTIVREIGKLESLLDQLIKEKSMELK